MVETVTSGRDRPNDANQMPAQVTIFSRDSRVTEIVAPAGAGHVVSSSDVTHNGGINSSPKESREQVYGRLLWDVN